MDMLFRKLRISGRAGYLLSRGEVALILQYKTDRDLEVGNLRERVEKLSETNERLRREQ